MIIAFNSLYGNFKMIIAPELLDLGNKDVEKIQQIVFFIKVANLVKQAVGAISDITLIIIKNYIKKSKF